MYALGCFRSTATFKVKTMKRAHTAAVQTHEYFPLQYSIGRDLFSILYEQNFLFPQFMQPLGGSFASHVYDETKLCAFLTISNQLHSPLIMKQKAHASINFFLYSAFERREKEL